MKETMHRNYIVLLSAFIASTSMGMDDTQQNKKKITLAIKINVSSQGRTTSDHYNAINTEVERLRMSGQVTPDSVLNCIKNKLAIESYSIHAHNKEIYNVLLDNNLEVCKYRRAFSPIKRALLEVNNLSGMAVQDENHIAVVENIQNAMTLSAWQQSGEWNNYEKRIIKVLDDFDEPIAYTDWSEEKLLILTKSLKHYYAFKNPHMEECLATSDELKEARSFMRDRPNGRVLMVPAELFPYISVDKVSNCTDKEQIVIDKVPSLEEIAAYLCTQPQMIPEASCMTDNEQLSKY